MSKTFLDEWMVCVCVCVCTERYESASSCVAFQQPAKCFVCALNLVLDGYLKCITYASQIKFCKS